MELIVWRDVKVVGVGEVVRGLFARAIVWGDSILITVAWEHHPSSDLPKCVTGKQTRAASIPRYFRDSFELPACSSLPWLQCCC